MKSASLADSRSFHCPLFTPLKNSSWNFSFHPGDRNLAIRVWLSDFWRANSMQTCFFDLFWSWHVLNNTILSLLACTSCTEIECQGREPQMYSSNLWDLKGMLLTWLMCCLHATRRFYYHASRTDWDIETIETSEVLAALHFAQAFSGRAHVSIRWSPASRAGITLHMTIDMRRDYKSIQKRKTMITLIIQSGLLKFVFPQAWRTNTKGTDVEQGIKRCHRCQAATRHK